MSQIYCFLESATMKRCLLVSLLALITQSLSAQNIKQYNGTLDIVEERQAYDATLDILFDSYSNKDTLRLFIQGGAEIHSVKSKGLPIEYSIVDDKVVWDSREKTILIPVQNIVQKKIRIQYSTKFAEIQNPRFRYDPNWTEFNIYTNWFPWNIEYGLFDYSLKISSNDPVIGANLSENGTLGSPVKTFDIPFLISSKAQKRTTENGNINLFHYQVADTIIDTIQDKSDRFFSYYEKTYGTIDSDELIVIISKSDRDLNYSRPRFVSLSLNDGFTKTDAKTLAHEIAHLWWNKAEMATWEDWLNEAFAEFSAMIIHREEYGRVAFDDYVRKMGLQFEELELPAIWGIEKSDPNSNRVLTYKGALILLELEKKIGEERMKQLLGEMHVRRIMSTEGFLDLLSELTDINTSGWFERQLQK